MPCATMENVSTLFLIQDTDMSQKQDLPLIPLIHHWVFFAPACAVLQRS